jgi:hypothetical protein
MQRTADQVVFALLYSANVVMIFAHGLFGLGSVFTGVYLASLTAFLILVGWWFWRGPNTVDYLVAALAALFAISLALHPPHELKPVALLVLSLAAYPAARGFGGCMQKPGFVVTIAITVAMGVIATLIAILRPDMHGTVMIFGFDHGAAQFSTLVGILIFAFACSSRPLFPLAMAIFLSVAVFVAAQVHFMFLMLLATLSGGAIISPTRLRRIIVISAVIVAAIVAGSISRGPKVEEFVGHFKEAFLPRGDIASIREPGSLAPRSAAVGCPEVDLNNPLDVRKRLYREAFGLLPFAGLTGFGLNGFKQLSCIGTQVHNQILQTAVEFGIPAGCVLVLALFRVLASLLRLAPTEPEALFALLSLSFAVLISCVYGLTTDSDFIFLTLGYASATANIYGDNQVEHSASPFDRVAARNSEVM